MAKKESRRTRNRVVSKTTRKVNTQNLRRFTRGGMRA